MIDAMSLLPIVTQNVDDVNLSRHSNIIYADGSHNSSAIFITSLPSSFTKIDIEACDIDCVFQPKLDTDSYEVEITKRSTDQHGDVLALMLSLRAGKKWYDGVPSDGIPLQLVQLIIQGENKLSHGFSYTVAVIMPCTCGTFDAPQTVDIDRQNPVIYTGSSINTIDSIPIIPSKTISLSNLSNNVAAPHDCSLSEEKKLEGNTFSGCLAVLIYLSAQSMIMLMKCLKTCKQMLKCVESTKSFCVFFFKLVSQSTPQKPFSPQPTGKSYTTLLGSGDINCEHDSESSLDTQDIHTQGTQTSSSMAKKNPVKGVFVSTNEDSLKLRCKVHTLDTVSSLNKFSKTQEDTHVEARKNESDSESESSSISFENTAVMVVVNDSHKLKLFDDKPTKSSLLSTGECLVQDSTACGSEDDEYSDYVLPRVKIASVYGPPLKNIESLRNINMEKTYEQKLKENIWDGRAIQPLFGDEKPSFTDKSGNEIDFEVKESLDEWETIFYN